MCINLLPAVLMKYPVSCRLTLKGEDDTMEFATKCIHEIGAADATGSITPAIYLSSTFAHLNLGDTTGFNYTRESNPTRARLEQLLASLENGVDALAFSSGMAAIDAVMNLFAPGDHIITGNDLYGGSFRLFRNLNAKNGVEFTSVHTSKLEEIKAAIKPNTKAIFLETPTNPTMEISDLRAISKIAHENNFLVIVDNTFLTPYFQRPLDLGADIVIHSATESLITYPIRQTHTDLTAEECAEKEITDCLLRFSTGIEATQDLIDDLAQSFAAVK